MKNWRSREFPQFIAPTLVTRDAARLRAFHAEHGDVILKPLDGMGGTGFSACSDDALNLGSIIEMLTDNGRRTIMAQRYIPEIARRRQAHPADRRPSRCRIALARIPQGRRSARQSGGRRPRRGAADFGARPRNRRNAGADPGRARPVAGRTGRDRRLLTEVNVTSPTCFQEITAADRLRCRRACSSMRWKKRLEACRSVGEIDCAALGWPDSSKYRLLAHHVPGWNR